MIAVVLRDGRVLKYNHANNAEQKRDHFRLFRDTRNAWSALIPVDVVERIDGVKPCQIKRENRDKKRMKLY